ncbi:uncharacterized protein LOC101858607 [Aplysia californica]|uniref:Uncharacterized protein LOC101858607 n=1 Tax=Aplysia californica TaxID=6500 RepID=A0ABM0JGB1_APLCA|nr:uncharacterized protein LOC101858607 [Aplysia californica]XP_005093057.1 uncharacterized protein LOC101858607 [Aplysia californica]XP_005093058.1 uncharacterized protein LOC101858607 [Aplysia californica]
MGIRPSNLRQMLGDQPSKERCYPVTSYLPFNKNLWPAGAHGLLTDFHVLPEKLHRAVDDSSWFWWCDAQFVPFNDGHLFATASAFQPRAMHHWISQPRIPNGRVLLYNIENPDRLRCEIFSRTSCSVFPKMQPHPLGQLICYCGTGEVAVLASDADPVYSRSRDLTNAVHVYCAVSSNGIFLACLKRGMGVFFLETHILDVSLIGADSVRCHNLCPGFLPSKTRADNVACKFSPDWNLIAVSGAGGYLFMVGRRKMDLAINVCPDLVDDALSAAQAFDFNPCFDCEIITIGTASKKIQIVDIEKEEILLSVDTEEHIDCITYSTDGTILAVGFHNFDIHILESDELTCVHSIPMSELCQDQTQRVYPYYPAVHNLSFSQNAEHLVSTSCDGHLRLWRIPRQFSLQELCRDRILSCVPIRKVKRLNLPQKIKNFLVYKYN